MFFKKNNFSHEKTSLNEALASSLVVGLAENYFIAYALYLGVSVIQSGLLASLPLLVAGFSPFVFRRLYLRFTNSTWVLIACLIQAVALALLAFIGAFTFNHSKTFSFYALLIVFTVYWLGQFSSLPSWNKWISEVISEIKSKNYFSARTRRVQIGTVAGLFVGGFILHLNRLSVSTGILFIILFLIAYHIKILSFYFFYKKPRANSHYDLNWTRALDFLKRHKGFFIVYSIFNVSLHFSAPYVSGYLLSVRGLAYQDFMWVMAALFIGKIVTTLFLDRYKLHLTPHNLYFWGGLLAAPLPALWPYCSNVLMLGMLHFVSGLGWAAWEIGMSLAIFKKINPNEKIEAVTIYNMIGLPTQVLGTLIGAGLLKYFYINDYTALFITAGVVRFIFIIPMYFQKFGEN